MAKSKNADARPSSDAGKSRTSICIDAEWMSALTLIATMRKLTIGDYVQSLVARDLATMPRKESDGIRMIVSSTTGKALRLDNGVKASSETPQLSASEPAGQGSGGSEQACDATETHSTVNPPGRLDKIAQIKRRSVEDPTDQGIAIIYN